MAQLIHGTTIANHAAIHAGNMVDHDIATRSYVTTQIDNLIDGAPGALDTLNELAAALGDNASFATSVTNGLAGKLSNDPDSEQDVGGRYFRFNNGGNRINIDPRWNESGYDADMGVFHMYSTTAAGAQWGRTGLALYTGSAYQYLTTKANTTGIFLNDREILTTGNIGSYALTSLPAHNHTIAEVTGLQTALNAYLPLSGGILSGTLNFSQPVGLGFANGQFIKDNGNGGLIISSGAAVNINGTSVTINGSTVWHSGNDGSTSGLDADLLDGFHASVAGTANTIPTRNASGYLIPENWIQLNGTYGFYSPTNGAHLYPNNGTYGSWKIDGTRNGWNGLEFNASNGAVVLMVNPGSNTTGFHNNSYGWQFFWEGGTLYCFKNTYGGGTQATVLDSVNVGSYALTSYTETDTLNSVTGRGNTTSNSVKFGSHVDLNPTNSAFRFFDGTTFRGGFGTDRWGHGGSDADLVVYVDGDNTLFFSTSGTKRASLSSGAFNSLVALQQNGNQVWHAGNLTQLSQLTNNLGNYGGFLTSLPSHNHDDRYYTETESDTRFVNASGDTMTGSLRINGSTSGQELFAVDGTNGRLFTVTDDLSDSLFSVNTIAGLPVIEAFANNIVNIGPYSAPVIFSASGIATPSHGTSANWFTAFNKRPTAIAFSGSSTKNLRLTLGDGTFLDAAFNDIDTDTNTDGQTLSISGSTLTISGGNSITIPAGGIAQADADARYLRLSGGTLTGDLLSTHPFYPGYNNSGVQSQGSYYLYGNTSNAGIRTNNNFLADGDIYLGTRGNWLSTYLNQAVQTGSAPTFTNIYNNAWFRNNNANEGLYNQATAAHLYSSNGSGWTVTGSGGIVELVFRSNHQSTIRGYVYADTSNNIGFLANDGNWGLQLDSSKNVKVFGYLTVGNSTASDIYMTDSDEGNRIIHCNSNRIGFLNQASGWGAYCDDAGNWRTDYDMHASYFYGSGSIRLGDMWGGAGLYRPGGSMVFGLEDSNSDWIFSTRAVTQAYFAGGDGNLWMRWAGDWLSNLLAAKQNNLGFTPYNSTNPSGFITSSGSISGTSGNSSQLNGLSKVQLWNNSGSNHEAYQSFGAIPNFGVWFMQNSGAGDSPQGGSQYYVQTQGLGVQYPYGTGTGGAYALMTAVARDHTRKYTYYRNLEGGSWTAWSKGAAGYADEAGSITSQANSATINASSGVNGNDIVRRDGNGYIYANHINFNTSESENPAINSFFTSNGDGWSRKSSLQHVRNQLGNYGGFLTGYTETDTLQSVTNRGNTTSNRLIFQYSADRYSQAWNNTTTGAYWWVITDGSQLGFHLNGVGDKFYFSNAGDFYSDTNGWLSTALAAKQNASTAINTGNIGSQSVAFSNRSYIVESTNSFRHQNRNPDDWEGLANSWHFNDRDTLGISGSDFWVSVLTVNPWFSYDPSHRQQQLSFSGSGGLSHRYATSSSAWSSWSRIYSDAYRPYADNSGTTSQRDFSGDISTSGQGRFAGWYTGNAQTGLAAEIGTSGGQVYIIAYNRQSSAYGTLNLESTGTNLKISGSTVNVTTGTLQQGGNAVIHAGNIGSQSVSFATSSGSSSVSDGLGTSFLGNGSTNISSGFSRVIRNENGAGGNPTYAPVLHLAASDTMWQIAAGHAGQTNLVWRSGYAGSWETPWWTILHTGNYTSFAPSLTGTGASGSWGISITGNANTATTAARATRANGNFYIDDNHGHSIVGLYSSTILQGVFAMGDAYKLTAGGGAGNLYGLAWSHPNAGGVAGNLNTHGLLVMENGTFLAAISGSIRARDDVRAPIFYDSANTAYYVDPNATSNIFDLSITGASHKYLTINPGNGYEAMVRYIGGSGSSWYVGKRTSGQLVGTESFHFYSEAAGATVGGINPSGDMIVTGSMRAPIFYDSDDTGYYLDPNGTSNLLKFSGRTMAFNDMNPMSANSPYTDRYNGSTQYRNGTMGYGRVDFNTIFSNWGSGFIDTWSSPANAPGGSSHYVGLQGFHYNHENSTNAYGFQMACAGEADNRFFWRSAWPTLRGWVEMIHSGTIGSQSVSFANSAGSLSNMNISQFSNNSGYITSSGSISGSAGSVAWGNVSSKPAAWLNETNLIVDNVPNTAVPSGFYQSYLGAGNPTGTWFNYINVRHSNPGNGHGFQLGMSYYDTNLWFRSYQGGLDPSYSSWGKALSSLNHTEYMDAPNKAGTSYYQVNTWMQFNGTYGLYWPSHYDAHFSANDLSTYTQFAFRGEKNGYGGFHDQHSRVNGAMYDSGGNGGVYREANGLWYFYYHVGNNSMGIGSSTTSASYVVYASGSIYATGDIVAFSDRRKKTDIVTIDSALDKVMAMRGVFYTKIDESDKGRQVGVIAQEVNEILPEAVTYAADVDEYGVKYGNIVGVLIEAIKEQQKEINELITEVKKLKGE